MKKNSITMALLVVVLLSNTHIQTTNHRPANSATNRLKKQIQAFKDAFACAREKGFGACTPAQKKRIVATVAAVIVTLAALGYGGVRGAAWWRSWQEARRKAFIAQRVKEQKEEVAREQQAEEQRQKPPEMEVDETLLERVRRFFSQPEEKLTIAEQKDLALAKELAGQWEEEEEEEEEELVGRAGKEEVE